MAGGFICEPLKTKVNTNDAELSDGMFILKLILSWLFKIEFWSCVIFGILFSVFILIYCIGYTTLYIGADIFKTKILNETSGFMNAFSIFGCGLVTSIMIALIVGVFIVISIGCSECYGDWRKDELKKNNSQNFLPVTNTKQSEFSIMLNSIPEVITIKKYWTNLFPTASIRKYVCKILIIIAMVVGIFYIYCKFTYLFGYYFVPVSWLYKINPNNPNIPSDLDKTIMICIVSFLLQVVLALVIGIIILVIILPSLDEWNTHKQKQAKKFL